MFVVDTNVLIYAADADSPFHSRCRDLITEWRAQTSAWFVTWGILYEFLRVTTHPRVFRRPWAAATAWAFVEALLASPFLGILAPTERHGEIAADVVRKIPHLQGNIFHDAQTAVLMREHGIKTIYTRDMDFHHFPFIQPVDPMTSAE